MEKSKLCEMDYGALVLLAGSMDIKVVEVRGLDSRRGIRFCHEGSEWILLDRDLPRKEKNRTLGFLLSNERADFAKKLGIKSGVEGGGGMTPVLTLCC